MSLASLNDTDLSGADLSGAFLRGADLSDAKGITQDTLAEQAGYLGETIMPDGHESAAFTVRSGEEYPSGKIPPGPPGTRIPAGEYNSDEFVPAFHFEVGEGWETTEALEATDYIALAVGVTVKEGQYASSEGEVLITNPLYVLDASNLSEQKEIPAPESTDKWVSWFQEHPNLDISEPIPVTVGSVTGQQIDVTVASTPENYPQVCGQGQPCVDLYYTNFTGVVAFEGRTERFVILDVGEETVVVNVSAPADKRKEFFSKAQKLLETVEWKDT